MVYVDPKLTNHSDERVCGQIQQNRRIIISSVRCVIGYRHETSEPPHHTNRPRAHYFLTTLCSSLLAVTERDQITSYMHIIQTSLTLPKHRRKEKNDEMNVHDLIAPPAPSLFLLLLRLNFRLNTPKGASPSHLRWPHQRVQSLQRWREWQLPCWKRRHWRSSWAKSPKQPRQKQRRRRWCSGQSSGEGKAS